MKGKKQAKGKWNFLLMRPQGEVINFAVSPILLAVALLFALVFAIGAVLAINQYFSLYLEYQEVSESQREALARLNKVDDQYQYQISLTQDYAELLSELDLPDPGAGSNGAAPAEPEAAAGRPKRRLRSRLPRPPIFQRVIPWRPGRIACPPWLSESKKN